MTAKIKLNAASGGGSFSLQAPSSSSNNRVMTLPDTADGTIITSTNLPDGLVKQHLQTTYSTQVNNTTSSFADTGLTLSITPTSTGSKILVLAQQQVRFYSQSQFISGGIKLVRTVSGSATSLFETPNSYSSVGSTSTVFNTTTHVGHIVSLMYLDTAINTNAHVYKTQVKPYSTNSGGNATSQRDDCPSNIVLLEIL